MPNDQMMDEVRRTVAHCIEHGTLLRVGAEAQRIAEISGVPLEHAADQLRQAGVLAHVNVEFGAPMVANRGPLPVSP